MDIDSDEAQASTSSSKAVAAYGRKRSRTDVSKNLEGPPDGFMFVLPFLDLRSRLRMEQVSKSLRDEVRSNPLVWRRLHVDWRTMRKLTNDLLITLARRAQGQLKSLRLEPSTRITKDSLEWILVANPGLEQLAIPGCFISAESIVTLVEGHSLCLKQVEIRGLFRITEEHLTRLHQVLQLVGPGQLDPPGRALTHRYYGKRVKLRSHDAGPIDVEVCRGCKSVRTIYDCPCKYHINHSTNNTSDSSCRGCYFCIPRCKECGVCTVDIRVNFSSYPRSVSSFPLKQCKVCLRAVCYRHNDHFIRSFGSKCYECELTPWFVGRRVSFDMM